MTNKVTDTFDKLKNSADVNKGDLKNLAAGTFGGFLGAVATQPIDTLATVKQNSGKTLSKVRKILKVEAYKNLSDTASKSVKALALFRRYNAGLLVKSFKIAPATGIAFATHSYLTKEK